MNTKEINDIISQNKDNIAFLIGNGIHYQYKDSDESWKDLLIDLWKKFVSNEIDIPEGISLTEFYDIIELNYFKCNPDYTDLFNKLKNSKKLLQTYNGIDFNKVQKNINSLAIYGKPFDKKNVNQERLLNFNKTLKSLDDKLKKMIGIDQNDDYDFDYLYLLDILSNDVKKKVLYNDIKNSIIKKYPQKEKYNLEVLIRSIVNLDVPILTTNFDTYMSDSVNATKHILKKNGKSNFTDFYPWNVYYSFKDLEISLKGFSIWHINGMVEYPRSIKLGLSDYMGCVERARKMIQGKSAIEFYDGKNKKYWAGYNTWLHIIFNKDLFIFGLALDENEVFLRWLLIQRAKYAEMYNQSLKGWYVNKNINQGKKFFLNQLGFEVIDINDYDILYKAFKY